MYVSEDASATQEDPGPASEAAAAALKHFFFINSRIWQKLGAFQETGAARQKEADTRAEEGFGGARPWARERKMIQVKLSTDLLIGTLTMIQDKDVGPKGCLIS